MLQETVHFILSPAPDCLLAAHISKEKIAPKCFPIDPRQDGCFGFCSGGWLINTIFLNFRWPVLSPFPERERVCCFFCFWKLKAKFSVPRRCWFFSSIQAASLLSENPFPKPFTILLETRLFSSEKLIAVKTSQNCIFIVDQWEEIQWVLRQHLSSMSTKFCVWMWRWKQSCETSWPHASKPGVGGHFLWVIGIFSDLVKD